MNSTVVFALAFGIGIVAGLRSFTAPAAVSVGAWLKWFSLENSPLHFMASGITAAIFCVLAVGELIMDKLPSTPNRTAPGPLIARIVFGALAGATLSVGGGQSLAIGAVLGAIGSLVGAFGGFQVRMRLMKMMSGNVAAIMEDVVAVVAGFFLASRA
jgi:uncharacterized membrane protein